MKLVIINCVQFGYHIDTYYYCKYLRTRYDLTYIGWDQGLKKMEMEGVNVIYISRQGGFRRLLRFLKGIKQNIYTPETIIFLKYFKGLSFIVRILYPKNIMILDIRTGSVKSSKWQRYFQDTILKLETKLFKNITVISRGLAYHLRLTHKAIILPLGADVISQKSKEFNRLRLIYVGTLHNRNIDKAVRGFIKYCRSTESDILSPTFTIIGAGLEDEEDKLKKLVKEQGFEEKIQILGRIPHDQLKSYFDSCNIGISYVPMTDYYDVQPVTKTFEYLLSGIAVLGTATSENSIVINESNGVLCGDSPEQFAKGLKLIHEKMSIYNSSAIRDNATIYQWSRIIDHLHNYVQSLLTQRLTNAPPPPIQRKNKYVNSTY